MTCWLSNGEGPLEGQHYKPPVVGGRLRNKNLAGVGAGRRGGGGRVAEEMTGLPKNAQPTSR